MKIHKIIKRKSEHWIFITPWVVGLCAFFLYPLILSLRLTMSKITTLFKYQMDWVGFDNFKKALFVDAYFLPLSLESLKQVAIYVPAIVIVSMIIAILLNKRMRLQGLFRSMFFLPVLLGSGFVMSQLLEQGISTKSIDVVQQILSNDALKRIMSPNILDSIAILFQSITMILWKCGVQILIFLAGLQSISGQLYEAARVDAATEWEIFWKITMPMLAPITILNVVYTIIDSFTDLQTPVIRYILDKSGNYLDMGVTAAMSWSYLGAALVLVGIIYYPLKRYLKGVS